MQKYGFVYIWRDRKYNRYYIGSHWGTEDDGYVCSSSWMIQAYKLRPKDFKRRILTKVYTNRSKLLEKEYHWLSLISEEEIKNKKYYNRTKHKNGYWMAEDYEKDVTKRISQNTKEAMQRPEVREKYLEGLKSRDSRSSDPEVREKRRQSMIKTMAEKFPEENRNKPKEWAEGERTQYYSDKAKKIWATEGHKEKVGPKISQGLIGKKNRLGQKNSKQHTDRMMESYRKTYNLKVENYRSLIEETLHLPATKASKIIGVCRGVVTKYRRVLGYK
jgi:hypothetical protein